MSELREKIQWETSLDPSFRQSFWDLAVIDEKKRLKAAEILLNFVKGKQQTDKQTPTRELNYAIDRLVMGLASSRDAARQGFATALTQVCFLFIF